MFFNTWTRTNIRCAERLRIPTDVPTARRATMEPTSRRQFLKRSSAVAAAAGVAAAVPVSAAKALSSSDKSHHDDREPQLPDDASVDVPVVAHVRDVRKGLVSLYTGEREVSIKNKRLAAALYHATH
jgi:TAT (twin-arginine translocation) pathway signal sequence